jgi:predicted pyridoxine 5'-phosphate oxidase superfamily flavin-nucleotide-binding protein
METSAHHSSDVAFSPSVKAQQRLKGSRGAYEHMERAGSWATVIPPDLKSFVEAQTSIFLATANSAGQPYIQHRGGPAGFLRVLNENTLGFADFAGNRQYISIGNISDNPKVHLFLIDYASRHRVKIWGAARVVENDAELMARLKPQT